MANTYTQIYIHIVFAVQGRQNLVRADHQVDLQKYMTGIVTHLGSKLIAINNMPDHFHLLVGLKPDLALSDLVGTVKAGSSNYINAQHWVMGRFEWQEGYGGFSYSHSQLSTVIRYIRNPEKHHTRTTFLQEYQSILDRFAVPHDERYVFRPAV